MTYRELLIELLRFSEEQLNSNVCVYDTGWDEHYQLNVQLVFGFRAAETDILDIDYPVIRFWSCTTSNAVQSTTTT